MSSILYYSNFCEPSKKILQTISKTQMSKDIHFICIDNRVKDATGKIFIVLQNGQKIIMPENVTKVPALLLLNQNYKVIYGDDIYKHFKPTQQAQVKQATQNNMEPTAFSFGGGCVTSDQYSFLDMDSEALKATGNGGMRQMHNYVDLNFSDQISTPVDEAEYKKTSKMPEDMTVEKLQQQREQEIQKMGGGGGQKRV